MTLPRRVDEQLAIQGYDVRDGEAFERVAPWIRFSPVLCSVGGALGTLLAAPSLVYRRLTDARSDATGAASTPTSTFGLVRRP